MRKLILWVAAILVLTVFLSNTAFSFTYEKVGINELIEPPSKWAKPEIDTARDEGLLTENTCTSFTNNITRFQFAELVVNMSEKATGKVITAASDKTFIDCSDTAVLKAYAAGIVNGVSKTTFEPKTLITREQIAHMLYNAIQYIEKTSGKKYITKNGNIDNYKDKKEVSLWAKASMCIIVNNNIMKGTLYNTLTPKGNATTEECISLVYRLYNIVKSK